MRIDILTLFPSMFHNLLKSSILRIAQDKGFIEVRVSNIRNFTYDRHRSVDDRPYGGGPGMLLKPEPIFRAVEAISAESPVAPQCILMSPQGEVFNQELAWELSKEQHLLFLCGHYEGFDERVREGLKPREVSIGDYVLTGGEIPAMVVMDAVMRLIPGVLGEDSSVHDESFSSGLLEYPQYTRPLVWRGMEVPEVLRSGNHRLMEEWKKDMARLRTKSALIN